VLQGIAESAEPDIVEKEDASGGEYIYQEILLSDQHRRDRTKKNERRRGGYENKKTHQRQSRRKTKKPTGGGRARQRGKLNRDPGSELEGGNGRGLFTVAAKLSYDRGGPLREDPPLDREKAVKSGKGSAKCALPDGLGRGS